MSDRQILEFCFVIDLLLVINITQQTITIKVNSHCIVLFVVLFVIMMWCDHHVLHMM